MRVFVLNYLCEYEDYPCEMYCEGVFFDRSVARECMEKLYAKKLQEWIDNYVKKESDIEKTDFPNFMKLFNTANNIDYVKYEIVEKDIE